MNHEDTGVKCTSNQYVTVRTHVTMYANTYWVTWTDFMVVAARPCAAVVLDRSDEDLVRFEEGFRRVPFRAKKRERWIDNTTKAVMELALVTDLP
jgi:hypothetical protein